MPLLFVLGTWGVITSLRPRPYGRLNYTRFIILAAGSSVVGVVLWGYIANRYMTDFMPLLIVGGAVGLVDICRRLEKRPKIARRSWYVLIGIGALFGLIVNVALAIAPQNTWFMVQSQNFLNTQRTLSPAAQLAVTSQGATLPYFAPASHLFIARPDHSNTCSGLYLSSGDTFINSPGQQLQHETWNPVEQGPGIKHEIKFRLNVRPQDLRHPVPLLSWGSSTLQIVPTRAHWIQLVIKNPSAPSITWPAASGPWIAARPHVTYGLVVVTDPNMHQMSVSWQGTNFSSLGFGWLKHYIAGPGPAIVWATYQLPGKPLPTITVDNAFEPKPDLSLCTTLLDSLGQKSR